MSARQDYTGYTEVDAGNRVTVAASVLTIASLLGNDSMYIYKNFTANYFAADFEHTITFTCTVNTSNPIVYLWGMTNATEAIGTSVAAGTTKLLSLHWAGATRFLTLSEGNGTDVATQAGAVALTVGTQYWIRICRDETISAYGTLYAYIYSNAQCTELVEVVTLALRIKTDFQYLYATSGQVTGLVGATYSGTIQNLTLDYHAYSMYQILAVLRTLLDEPVPNYFTDTQLKAYVNQAIREIVATSGCIRHIDAATTANGVRLTSFTGHKAVAVEYIPAVGTPYYLVKINPVQVDHVPVNRTAPQFWFEFGGNVGIEPLPDATYNLNIYLEDIPPADITVPTAASPLPKAFNPLIIYKALQLAYMQDNKQGAAVQMFSIYRNELIFGMQDKLQNVPDGTLDLKFV